MKKLHSSLLIAAVLLLFAGINATAQNPVAGQTDLTVEKFQQYITAHPKTPVLDVRTAEEFATGHIKGATNVPVNDSNFNLLVNKIDKTAPVMVYCRSGHRSRMACTKLAALGFTQIYNLDKGIVSWQEAGKPVTK